jgi:hypothetical protein
MIKTICGYILDEIVLKEKSNWIICIDFALATPVESAMLNAREN